MISRLFSLLLLLFSIEASANPYFKLGLGINHTKLDKVVLFSNASRATLNKDQYLKKLSAGYTINPNFALEASYERFSLPAQNNTSTTSSGNTLNNTSKTKLTGDRLNLKSLYLRNFDNDLQLHTGIGLTVTQYDFESNTQHEAYVSDDSDIPKVNTLTGRSDVKVGAVANIGIDYPLGENFTLGADANVSIDNLTSTLQLIGTVGYRF